MKIIVLTMLFTLSLFADRIDDNTKPINEIIEVIENAGYTEIKEIEYDDGVWKVTVFLEGKKRKLTLHPETGEVIKDKASTYTGYMERVPKDAMPLAKLVKSLNENGYKAITEISLDGGVWEIEVYVDNKKKELMVNVKTGKVLIVKNK